MPNLVHNCRTSTLIMVPINFRQNSDPFKTSTQFVHRCTRLYKVKISWDNFKKLSKISDQSWSFNTCPDEFGSFLSSLNPSWPAWFATLSWPLQIFPDKSWLFFTSSDYSWSFLIIPDQPWLFLTSRGHSWPVLILPVQSWSLLTSPDQTWSVLTSPDYYWPVLTSPGHSWPVMIIPDQ